MPLIPFPNIPDLPGVPAIPRLPNATQIAQTVLSSAQGALWSTLLTDRRWGIYDQSGNPLADPSNVTGLTNVIVGSLGLGSTLSFNSLDYTKETHVSDYPIERGNFAQYNKVENPGTPTVLLTFTGSESDRSKFLLAIDAAGKGVDLYDVVTPEVTYLQHSIESYRYSRHNDAGATLLRVEINLLEIRQVSAQYTNSIGPAVAPANTDAAATVNAGKIQALSPVQSVLNAISKKITALATVAVQQVQSVF